MKQKNESIGPKPPIFDRPITHPQDTIYPARRHDGKQTNKPRVSTPAISFYQSLIQTQATILHIQSGTGDILSSLDPLFAVGIDTDKEIIAAARKKYPAYQFYESETYHCPVDFQFDYIILGPAAVQQNDLYHLLSQLHQWASSKTRIIIDYCTPIYTVKEQCINLFRAKKNHSLQLFRAKTMNHVIAIAGFQEISRGYHTFIPLAIPLVTKLLNKIIPALPVINYLCSKQYRVIRSLDQARTKELPSVSVIIPCRNEAGNIKAAVQRLPLMGSATEIIFVEGNSSDQTRAEIEQIIAASPTKNIRLIIQQGKGKADAVHAGFAQATGDIVMILDGDLTVAPEELPHFFHLLAHGNGEFINGSRLIYQAEKEAMGFLAFLANHGFAYLLSWVANQRVTDTLCGTKVLWRADYERIAAISRANNMYDPFGDFELLLGAAQLQLKIIDLPIHYKKRIYGESKINRFYEVWFLLWIVLRAAWQLRMR